jgi:hypothetical protein
MLRREIHRLMKASGRSAFYLRFKIKGDHFCQAVPALTHSPTAA